MKRNYQTEERFHAVSHGLGALFAILGCFLLLQKDPKGGSLLATMAISIYSASLVLLFLASTLYHLVHDELLKRRLRILDHISIYFLIAGTYTPVALITLLDGNGWLIFYTVWGIALTGAVLKLFFTGKFEFLSLALYLILGWLIVFDLHALIARSSPTGLLLLATGGAFYTLGIFFYAMRKIPYNHFIWHLFVLGGAISHWLFIYVDVI
jgi:hemolysin III